MAISLPDDLIFFQILARLPLKFLHPLTLVCKRWHFLIMNPGHIGFHRAHASYNLHTPPSHLINWYMERVEGGFKIVNKDQNNALVRSINDSIRNTCKQIFSSYDSMSEYADIYWVEPENAVSAVGSVRGLVCFSSNYACSYFIWNPITKMLKTVSEPPRELTNMPRHPRSKFYYDPIDRDYKIIEIVRYELKSEGTALFRVHVYSCNLDTWREIRYDSLPEAKFYEAGYFEGRFNLEFLSEPQVLVEFDIHNEVFKQLPCPKHTIEGAEYGDYINWEGSLGITVNTEAPDPGSVHGPQDVYVFYETKGTWIKQYNAPYCPTDYQIYSSSV